MKLLRDDKMDCSEMLLRDGGTVQRRRAPVVRQRQA